MQWLPQVVVVVVVVAVVVLLLSASATFHYFGEQPFLIRRYDPTKW